MMICAHRRISLILIVVAVQSVWSQHAESNNQTNLRTDFFSQCQTKAIHNVQVTPPNWPTPQAVKGQQTQSRPSNLLQLRKNFMTREQLKTVEDYFYQNGSRDSHGGVILSHFINRIVLVKLIAQTTNDYFIHRYDSDRDIRRAVGPQVNQELCLEQLKHLNERAEANHKLGPETKDLNFVHYIDSFGGSPSALMGGNIFWMGFYEQCRSLVISVPGERKYSPTKYCLGSLRYKNWPVSDPLDKFPAIKTALCLPASCDSLRYKNKFELIEKLNAYHLRHNSYNGTELTSIYCPPDDESELRTWWRSTPTLITVVLTCVWLLILVVATIIDERNRRRREREQDKIELEPTSGKMGLSTGLKVADIAPTDSMERVCRTLSITSNLRSLFSTGASSAASSSQRRASFMSKSDLQKKLATAVFVNLDILEGIKVLTALYIMSGHVVMLSTSLMNNGRDLASSRSMAWTISNLMPAFAVNAFFAITGILTTYLIFKQNQSRSFISSPMKWFALLVYRYLRTMPMYALVVLYCKHVARYTGNGPFWDYGTSSLAARRTCEQEPWAWTLLFGANFKSPLKHCIPSAWYLANDFQFFMVTPIFLAALHLRPRLGKRLLVVAVLAGYLAGMWNTAENHPEKIRPIGQFKPHGFMVYLHFLRESYTQPQFRIPAYLIGLLLGHMLFEYEQRRRAHLERVATDEACKLEPAPGLPIRLLRYGPVFSLLILIAVVLTPSITSRVPDEAVSDKVAGQILTFIMPTFHLLYAAAMGIYVLLASTGHGCQMVNQFLSLDFWKPLARLSLCVMLVNYEVISYLTQTSRTTQYMDNFYLTSLNLMSFVYTYIVATIVCVLFEAPIRAALNYLLAYLMNQVAVKKVKTKCD